MNFNVSQAWLESHAEEIIEPGLPIVDPHHHLWDSHGGYLLDELLSDTQTGHRIVATVFCQSDYGYRSAGKPAFRPVGETESIASLAREAAGRGGDCPRVAAGIIGYADLSLGAAAAPVLQAHIEAGQGGFRGVRHIAARHDAFAARVPDQPPPGLLAQEAFREGCRALQEAGLVFDAWVYHPQLYEVADLANALPGLSIVLDHMGGPLGAGPFRGMREQVFPWWREAMATLAACPNVTVKLGGLGMPIGGFDFHKRERPPSSIDIAAQWGPYIETCIELFGPSRCMFESNFPVDRISCSYPVLWNAYKRIAAGASDSEKAALFEGTATAVYRLDIPPAMSSNDASRED
ncbi:amidohydrolase [Alcaligenaceae bacterium]|nr:amidohydrolase [Alcaligenaceae bacterium]